MSQTPQMSEKELLNDILNQEKSIVTLYSSAITESTCQDLRQVFTQNLQQTCQDQYTVFDQMRSKGYYQPKDADTNATQQAKTKFATLRSQL